MFRFSRLVSTFSLALSVSCLGSFAGPSEVEPLIRVNQIGYLPDSNKVAVIADPQTGQNADESFTPGSTYQVRRWADDVVVFEAAPTIWNGGATDSTSGDRGWWFDFGSVSDPGSYYLWDVEREVGSYRFEIGADVYNAALVAAMRTFYYQRLSIAKEAAFAGEDWTDGISFLGAGQDSECRSIDDPQNADTERDLSGGWMDAGDYNKYVTFAEGPVHQLLNAFVERPEVFGDDTNIPESGNGIPDILDEIHFEMLWMTKMQEQDGGVLLKMGNTAGASASPPSQDSRPRYYVPSCSSSTIAAAGVYAHAALVFRDYAPWQEFAAQLEIQAIAAWNWYHANPKSANCDDQTVQAGDADRSLADQEKSALVASVYLHLLTEEDEYRQYVLDEFGGANVLSSGFYSVYGGFAGEAFLHYAESDLVPESIRDTVRQRKLSQENGDTVMSWSDNDDLYRAFMPDSQYHWGSLFVSANFANANLDYRAHGYDTANLDERRKRSDGFVDYFFGVNAMGLTYLTQFESFGAENSIQEIYHSWFAYNSEWDTNPPPGYVPGGPNKDYGGPVSELQNLPPQKSYLDFNEGWPESSWEITENAIYYQASFVKMLSKYASPIVPMADLGDDDGDGIANSFEDWFGFTQGAFDSWDDRVKVSVLDSAFSLEVLKSVSAIRGLVIMEYSFDLQEWRTIDPAGGASEPHSEGLLRERYMFESEGRSQFFVRFSLGSDK